jgi:hypothetical protein
MKCTNPKCATTNNRHSFEDCGRPGGPKYKEYVKKKQEDAQITVKTITAPSYINKVRDKFFKKVEKHLITSADNVKKEYPNITPTAGKIVGMWVQAYTDDEFLDLIDDEVFASAMIEALEELQKAAVATTETNA